jgi:hypothetical protein
MPQQILSGCCCDSNLCIDPSKNIQPTPPAPPAPPLSCWVGYAYNNTLRGGSIPCDTGTCVYINGTYTDQDINLYACEPYGVCDHGDSFSLLGLNVFCCNDEDNCNVYGMSTPPPPVPSPTLPPPIICYEGLYINNKNVSKASPKVCYGNCASVSANISGFMITVATCDPLSLCMNLDLVNSCHTMPQQILSGCCCNTDRCIDPSKNIQPTPPPPPSNSIKCFIGLQRDNGPPVGSEVYCPGMCHSTSTMMNNSNYTMYACDRYQVKFRHLIPKFIA